MYCWVDIVLASKNSSLYSCCVRVCMCVCAKRETRPHPPGRQTEAHIQCSLWKRAVPPVRSSPSLLSLHLFFSSFIFILFPFSYIYSPLQHTLLYFIHLALRIFSQNLSGFHFELVPHHHHPPAPHHPTSSIHIYGTQVKIEILALQPKQAPWLIIYLSQEAKSPQKVLHILDRLDKLIRSVSEAF